MLTPQIKVERALTYLWTIFDLKNRIRLTSVEITEYATKVAGAEEESGIAPPPPGRVALGGKSGI